MEQSPSRSERYRGLKRASDANAHALTILRARRFLADFPDAGTAWQLLGIALIEMARYEEARYALERAIEHCPAEKLWIPYAVMGDLFAFAGDYEQASTWHQKVIDGFPNDATGYIGLGGVLAKRGWLKEAEEVHRAGTRCGDGCIDEAFLNLGFVLRAQERFAEAAECFREAIRRDPNYRAAKKALRDVKACLRASGRAEPGAAPDPAA